MTDTVVGMALIVNQVVNIIYFSLVTNTTYPVLSLLIPVYQLSAARAHRYSSLMTFLLFILVL